MINPSLEINNKTLNRWLVSFIFLAMLANTLIANATDASQNYKFGIVPQYDARKLQTIWRPILDYIEKETGIHLSVDGSPTIPEFETEFVSGKFDFAYMNPYHMIVARDTQGYIPIVRDTDKELFGVLVVKKDDPIKDVKELAGKTIAFPAPNALGASLLMRADLKELYGIDIVPKYVQTHNSVYLNVALGQTAAGGGVQKTLNQQSKGVKDKLRILYKTRTVPPHPIAVHPRVPENVRIAVQQALLKFGESEEGKKALQQIPINKIGITSIKDYEPLSKMGLEKLYTK